MPFLVLHLLICNLYKMPDNFNYMFIAFIFSCFYCFLKIPIGRLMGNFLNLNSLSVKLSCIGFFSLVYAHMARTQLHTASDSKSIWGQLESSCLNFFFKAACLFLPAIPSAAATQLQENVHWYLAQGIATYTLPYAPKDDFDIWILHSPSMEDFSF